MKALDKLNYKNFLVIAEISRDISEALDLLPSYKDSISIPIISKNPLSRITVIGDKGDRKRALGYLCGSNNIINYYTSKFFFKIPFKKQEDRDKFRKFYIRLKNIYKKRYETDCVPDIDTEINYNSKAEREGWEKKWDVLQRIWSAYTASPKKDKLEIPIKRLIIKDRTMTETENAIASWQKEGCFKSFDKNRDNFIFNGIKRQALRKAYFKTNDIWNEFKDALEKNKAKNNNKSHNYKTKICISEKHGIFLEDNNKLKYPIKGKKRPKLVRLLKDGRKSANILVELCEYSGIPDLSKEINNINKIFKKKLHLENDLIIHVETGGYELNNDDHEIFYKKLIS